ncbi:MAG: helix-turn-helix transcriptional regulator [Oscillospiraceae bacterium]|nr:helix-turn-helix transcriptional regulator [Oscillospiraceae bacterium]
MYTSVEIREPMRLKSLYSFFRHHYDSDYSFRGEMHDFWEVVCVTKGRICVTAGEQVYMLSDGELIVHRPMEFHSFFVDDPDGADVMIFSFTAQTSLRDELSQKVFALDAFQNSIIEQMFVFLDARMVGNAAYQERWKLVVEEYESNRWFLPYMRLLEVDPYALVMAASFATQLLISLLESEGRSLENTAPDAAVFRVAVDYLNISVHKTVSVEELSRVVGLSISGLNRLFRKYAGVSVHRYFLMQKIKAATEYLQSGISVTETSRRLGFSNQSYFSACFKRETGSNPSEVLKK